MPLTPRRFVVLVAAYFALHVPVVSPLHAQPAADIPRGAPAASSPPNVPADAGTAPDASAPDAFVEGAEAGATPGAPEPATPEVPVVPPPPPVPAPSPPSLLSPAASGLVPPRPPITAPGPSASAGAPSKQKPSIQIGDKVLYDVRAPLAGQAAEVRARSASQALKSAVENEKPERVRVERRGDTAIVYAGSIPIIQLGPDDATAFGDASVDVHADRVASLIREAIRTEQKRSAIATTVFSLSLAVLFALAALYLLRKTSEFTTRARAWVTAHRDSIPGIRVKSLEVLGPAALRSSVVLAVELAKWLTRFGIVYLWLLVTLSLFASTRGYTERLTGLVISPLSSFASRVATSLPVLIVAAIAILVLAILLRFTSLFFASVARGETSIAGLPSDLALPTSIVVRALLVLITLIFAAPVITGDTEGPLSHSGSVALAALGLAATPLLACALVGGFVVFMRRLHVGEFAEFGGRVGRVKAVGLLEVVLESADGAETRVPQLLSLLHPTTVLGKKRRVSVELAVEVGGSVAVARDLLLRAAAAVGEQPRVDVIQLDRGAATFRVSVVSDAHEVRAPLYLALAEASAAARFGVAETEPPP